jgi:catechol 2,3-dioxygenase-like lactoylglutathione lyase family enzyme
MNLNLLVLRTPKLDEMRKFYSLLGTHFVDEQHGNGPAHCSAKLDNGTILELYPCAHGMLPDAGLRLGFTVDSLEQTLNIIEQRVPLKKLDCGVCALITDPDGRKVELVERKISLSDVVSTTR